MEFLKASNADLLHCCLHHYKTLKAVATAAIVVLTPANFFTISEEQNLTCGLSPSLLSHLAKNLQKQKSLLGSIGRQSKQKNGKKGFKSPAMKRQRYFTKICQLRQKSAVFWPLLRFF